MIEPQLNPPVENMGASFAGLSPPKHRPMEWILDEEAANMPLYLLNKNIWKPFELPYRVKSDGYQCYADVQREKFPVLKATASEGCKLSISQLAALSSPADKQEDRLKSEHKDLIIELMAEEIERLRDKAEDDQQKINSLARDYSTLADKLRTSYDSLDKAHRERAKTEEARLKALAKADAAEAEATRLEAALAKTNKPRRRRR